MPRQGPVSEESRENDEDDFDESLTWQEIAENNQNIITFKGVIEEHILVETENEEDKLPEQLLDAGNTILNISLGIKSVKSRKEDFEQLFGHTSSLVIVFWHLYNELGIPGTLWPPPNLRMDIEKLTDTVYYIYKLMKRKSHGNVAKRILVGYFGLRDLGKFKKYRRKLNEVASGFEGEPHNINISKVLLEIIESRNQDQNEDEDSELPEEPVEESVRTRKKKKATDQEASAERPRARKTKRKNESEEDSEEGVGDEENKGAKKKTARSRPGMQTNPNGTKGAKVDTSRHSDSDDESLDSEDHGKRARYQESDEDVEEGTSSRAPRKSNAAPSKTKKRGSPVYNDEERHTDVPVGDRGAPKGQSKKNQKSIPTQQKVESTPVAPQYSISGFSFNNNAGYLVNSNVGNIYNSTISDVGNDNSVNTFQRKQA